MKNHLASNTQIVENSDFENGAVKLFQERCNVLSIAEESSSKAFFKEVATNED